MDPQQRLVLEVAREALEPRRSPSTNRPEAQPRTHHLSAHPVPTPFCSGPSAK
jgi:hypothetical protein